MAISHIHEVKDWLKALQKKGYKTFTSDDLHELNMMNRGHILKAKYAGLIKKDRACMRNYGVFKRPTIVWRIINTG